MLSFLGKMNPNGKPMKKLREKLSRQLAEAVADVPRNVAAVVNQSLSAHQVQSLGHIDRALLLSGKIAAMEVQRKDRIESLADVEFRVTSQWGEDGIIEWLCHSLPEIPQSFIEFGVENYSEANTRFLLQNRGWKGLIFDGNASYMQHVRDLPLYWMFDLTAVPAFITAENINDLIKSNGFAGDLGILSVDIDGNDYWVLKAIDCVKPAIIICEINGVFGDLRAVTVPYDPAFERLKAHHSGQYFGCSLKAVRSLCEAKGYTFVGTNTNGVNAFFVRNDLASKVTTRLNSVRAWPARHRDSRDAAGSLTFSRGLSKVELIQDLPVVDLESNQSVKLRDMAPFYSPEFQEALR